MLYLVIKIHIIILKPIIIYLILLMTIILIYHNTIKKTFLANNICYGFIEKIKAIFKLKL